MRVGYEEIWAVVPRGTHRGGVEVSLPPEVEARVLAAEKEWEECLEILYQAAKERGYE